MVLAGLLASFGGAQPFHPAPALALGASDFGSVVILASGVSPAEHPRNGSARVAADGNKVHIVWISEQGDTSRRAALATSTDNGSTFPSPTFLSSDDTRSLELASLSVAAAGGNVYVSYLLDGETPGDPGPYRIMLYHNGVTTEIARDTEGSDPRDAQVAAAGNDVYVVWAQNTTGGGEEIRFARGLAGAPPTGSVVLSSSREPPKVAAHGSNVYVATVETATSGAVDILVRVSTNRGGDFRQSHQRQQHRRAPAGSLNYRLRGQTVRRLAAILQ